MMVAILAGGLATRLGELTRAVPKSMLPVGGEPFIAHQLRGLQRAGVTRVHLCLGHLCDSILDFVGDGSRFGLTITSSREERELLGTGGALALAKPCLDDFFGVLYGDSYLPVPVAALAKQARRLGTPAVMTVWRNLNRFDRSNLVVSEKERRVTVYSADRTDPVRYEWIDYGLSFLRREVVDILVPGKPASLAVVWGRLVAEGQLGALPVNGRFYEIGSVAGYEELNAMAREGALP